MHVCAGAFPRKREGYELRVVEGASIHLVTSNSHYAPPDVANFTRNALNQRDGDCSGVSREAAALAVDSPWLDLEHPMTEYEWAKAVAMIPMILIRLLITIVVLPLVWLYSLAVLADWPLDQPLPKWRMRILLPVLRFWAGVLIRIGFGMWPVYKGAAVCLYSYPRCPVFVRVMSLWDPEREGGQKILVASRKTNVYSLENLERMYNF